MTTEIKMPQLGLTMEEGTVERWLKAEGDPVKAGEPLLEITTDKLTNEVAAETDGVLLKIVAQEGADVPVKGLLGYIGRPGEQVGVPTAAAAPAAPAVEAAAASNGPGTVLVIGGGPGGYVAAIRAAQLGARVTLVEREHLGGTCLNIGCIPTKCLLHSAELVSQIKDQGAEIGVEADGVRVNFPQVIAHKNAVSKQLTSGVAGLLKANKVVKIDGEASFTGPKTLSVKKSDGSVEEMTADAIIVATGSVNAQPPIPG
uniref:FAD-dependent oxidoreductase n=1 Tax=Dysosmobacter welbionis TaxID=2093857 RepID=UPI003FEFA40E